MKRTMNSSSLVATAVLAGALGSHAVGAQTTPGAIPNPGTYQGSMQLQQEQDRQSQQYRQQSSQQYQPQQQLQSCGQGMSPRSSNSRRPPDCLDTLARRPELAPLAGKVYLAHPSVNSSALFDIHSSSTPSERPLLLKWLAGRRSCELELAKVNVPNWSAEARRADNLSARITNDMIVQLAEGKITYGQFNHQRAMNAMAVDKIP